jgi:hypothetical protein
MTFRSGKPVPKGGQIKIAGSAPAWQPLSDCGSRGKCASSCMGDYETSCECVSDDKNSAFEWNRRNLVHFGRRKRDANVELGDMGAVEPYYRALGAASRAGVESLHDLALFVARLGRRQIQSIMVRSGLSDVATPDFVMERMQRMRATHGETSVPGFIRSVMASEDRFCGDIADIHYYSDGVCTWMTGMKYNAYTRQWTCDWSDPVCSAMQVACVDCGGACQRGAHHAFTIQVCKCAGGDDDCKKKRREKDRERDPGDSDDGGDCYLPWILVGLAVVAVVVVAGMSGGVGGAAGGQVIRMVVRRAFDVSRAA